MLDLETCRSRQHRLLAHLRERNLSAILTTQIEHVQWLSGYRAPITMQPALWLTADGKATLVAPQKAPEKAAVDDILVYEAKRLSTMGVGVSSNTPSSEFAPAERSSCPFEYRRSRGTSSRLAVSKFTSASGLKQPATI